MKKIIIGSSIVFLIIAIIFFGILSNSNERNLVLEIYSNRIDCPTVDLKVYDNHTYQIEDRNGTYSYDVSKILQNIDQYEKDEKGPIIIKTPDGKTYEAYDTHQELKEFLKSIDVNIDTCASY